MDFESIVEWKGEYPGSVSCQNGLEIGYSPPVEFGGSKGHLSPEDAFVSAANMCLQIVFSRVAADLGIDVLEYRSRAVGKFEAVEGTRKFVSIEVYPEIRLGTRCDEARLQKALDAAKRRCPVTNSMDLEVTVSAAILKV